jgi:hypothetical protein
MDNFQPSAPKSRLSSFGKGFGIIGAVLCALLVVCIVATWISSANLRPGDVGGTMGIGMVYVFYIPGAAIPVFLFCFVGAILSWLALRQHASPDARTGLTLSLAGPGLVIVCYAAGFAII